MKTEVVDDFSKLVSEQNIKRSLKEYIVTSMRQKAVFRNNRQDSVKNDQIFTELSSPKKKRNTVNFMEESPDRHSSANL